MLLEVLISPWANLIILPRKVAVLCLVLSGSTSCLSLGVACAWAHMTGVPEICITVTSTILVGVCLTLLLHTNLLQRWEDNLDSVPWRQLSHATGQPSTLRCPFTGHVVSMRCPSCETLVSEAAWHKKDRLTSFLVGQSVLGWPKAARAMKVADASQGRAMLDEALDFRGNFYFGAVSACCIGCAAWQRCFILLPRWALTMACVSLVSTYSPWAFQKNLVDLDCAGGRLQAVALAFGMYCGACSLFVELHALAVAIVFMTKHTAVLPFPCPVVQPLEYPNVAGMVNFFAGCSEST